MVAPTDMAGITLRLICSISLMLKVSASTKCFQKEALLFGCDNYRAQYEHICCTVPQHAAEYGGFHAAVDFFGQLEAQYGSNPTEIVFYDSQCGIPLYVAPRGRSYDEWKQESVSHRWPSFRLSEVVHENVHVESGFNGELVSKCNTHLGHNLPDSKGRRDCVNLMCMSGANSTSSTRGTTGTNGTTGTTGNSQATGHGGSGSLGGSGDTQKKSSTVAPGASSVSSATASLAGYAIFFLTVAAQF